MKLIFSFFILFLLSQGVVFANGSQEVHRTISRSNANYRELLYIFYRGTNTELTDQIVTNYIRDFYESDFRNFRQNEFEWPVIFDRHRSQLASRIIGADVSRQFYFETRANLGNYNFELGGFDVRTNIEYLFVDRRGLSVAQGTVHPEANSRAILIFLHNVSNLNFFQIGRDEANAFITSRTRGGNVDRNVTLRIHFSIHNFFPDTGIFLIAQMNNSISARILRIDVYDGQNKIGELTSRDLVIRQSQPMQIPPIPRPRPIFFVNDSANVLTAGTIQHMNERSEALHTEKGVQLIFSTIATTGLLNLEDYSLQMWRTLTGGASNSNAILFVLRITPERGDWWIRWGGGSIIQAVGGENILDTTRRYGNDFSVYRSWDEGIRTIYDAIAAMF